MLFEELASLSPFPIVRIGSSDLPRDGILVPLSRTCRKHLQSNDKRCSSHYAQLAHESVGQFVQCPFGLASVPLAIEQHRLALTGVVVFPRFGTIAERRVAKDNPSHRVSREALLQSANALRHLSRSVQAIEKRVVGQYSMALHEIRKLNRRVKQTAERLCTRDSPRDADRATPDFVTILKTSELMSRQFDVIEILANEELARLPRNSTGELYRVFDKCVRIYGDRATRIVLDAPPNFRSQAGGVRQDVPNYPVRTDRERHQVFGAGKRDQDNLQLPSANSCNCCRIERCCWQHSS